MDFRRRPGPDEPDAQVMEDGPDHRGIFGAADYPHDSPTLRTSQGIDLVDLPHLTATLPSFNRKTSIPTIAR